MTSRKRYDPKFKQKLCELIITKTYSIKDLSNQYGISYSLLSRWYSLFLKENNINQKDNQQININEASSYNEILLKMKEVTELNEELQRENLILKKAISILSKT